MSLVRVISLVVAAAALGAGVAYALVGAIRPDKPAAVAPVVIDPAAGIQRATTTTAPRTTSTSTSTTGTARTTRARGGDDGWEAGPPIAEDDSGRGRGRGRGADDNSGKGSGGGDDNSGKGGGGGDDD